MAQGRILAFAALLALTGCTGYGPAGRSESSVVSRLAQQGFTLVSDGRSSDQPSVLRYSGDPAAAIVCGRSGGRYAAADQSNAITATNGLRARETGVVDAHVIVNNDGSRRGLYINTVTREVRTATGALAGRQVEMIEFPATGQAAFRSGLICKARP